MKSQAFGTNTTVMPTVRLDGQTEAGATVELVETGALTTADASGSFSFYPVNLPTLAAYTFTVKATDVAGNSSTLPQTFTRVDNTLPSNLIPPDVTLNLSETTARVGDTVTFNIPTQTHDGQPLASEVLLINGNQVPISPTGTASFSSLTPGVFNVVVKAFDAQGNEGDATQTLTFLTPPNGLTAPVAGFNETVVTPIVTMPTPIMGTANTSDMLQYALQYSVEGQNQWTTFATGTTPVINGSLGTIDPTTMENGYYDVRLTVEDTSGQVTTADEVYDVEGQAKIGDFTLSFQDVNIPNEALPITVTRTYDSRTKDTSGDFGYGWSLSTTNVTVDASSVLGAGFIETETQLPASQVDPLGGLGGLVGLGGFGGLPGIGLPPGLGSRPAEIQYSFQNTQNDYVTIYLPDGTEQKFIMGFTGVTYNFAAPPLATTSIFFVPLPGSGTTGTLQAMTNNNVIVSPAQVGPVTFIDQSTGQIYNPTQWKYTDESGDVYIIDTKHGLESVTDASGNTITYGENGESNSDGSSLTITRDSEGRITSITDPTGHQITYAYDSYGDLVSVTDQDGNVTRFTYDTNHLLLNVYDPLGREGMRTEYDSDGRVIAVVNAAGQMTTLNHDIAANMDQTVDALGDTTTVYYDDQGNAVTTIDPDGDVETRTFDSHNNELSDTVTLANGTALTTTYTYDDQNHRISMTDPLGDTTHYVYDQWGNLAETIDPNGYGTTTVFDAQGYAVSTTDAMGNTTTIAHNASGLEETVTDPLGDVTQNTYDIFGNLVGTLGPSGVHYQSSSDLLGDTTESSYVWTNPENPSQQATLSLQTNYDAKGQVIGTVEPNGLATSTAYDAAGRVVNTTDDEGRVTQYVYDVTNDLIETDYPNGTIMRTVYDALRRPIYTVGPYDPSQDPSQNIGTYTLYDPDGRVIEVETLRGVQIAISGPADNPSSSLASAGTIISTTINTYDTVGRLIATDVDGATTSYQYDAAGRRTMVTDALGNSTEYGFDVAGNEIMTQDPLGNVTLFTYDKDNRLIKTTYADGTSTETTYDALGRRTSSTDQEGLTTNYVYDPNGDLIATILPAVPDPQNGDALTRPEYLYTYDAYGDLLSETDPLGNVTRYTYDAYDRELSHTLPDGQTEYFEYDMYGRVTEHIDFDGQVTEYQYDAFDLPVTETYFASVAATEANQPSYVITTTYDTMGHPLTVTDSRGGTTKYAYNAMGQVIQVGSPEGTLNYEYDPVTGQVSQVSTSSTDIQYTYDALGRLSTVEAVLIDGTTAAIPQITQYHYSADGALQSVDYPNGVVATYVYDDLNRLIEVSNVGPNATLLSRYQYTLSADGQRIAETDATLESDGSMGTAAITYTYDALGRLTQEVSQDMTGDQPNLNFTESFAFDLAGNRIEATLVNASGTVSTITTFNGNSEETSEVSSQGANYAFTYDANGSLIQTADNGSVVARYSYDMNNQLVEATTYTQDASGNQIATTSKYTYDTNGNRTSTEVITEVNGSQTSDGWQGNLIDFVNPTGLPEVLEEHDLSGNVEVTFVYGLATISQTTVLTAGAQYRYFVLDGHNSTRLLTDQNGTITDRYDYDADGNALDFDAATAATTRLYAGYTFDRGTGLYYLNARYYDPSKGAFDESNPFDGDRSQPQSLIEYAYAYNDPINYSDATGRDPGSYDVLEALVTLGRGKYVHDYIGIDGPNAFENLKPGFLYDTPLGTILPGVLNYPGAIRPYYLLRPDLVSFYDHQVFEIKPNYPFYYTAGPAQLNGYLRVLNANDPVGRYWIPGTPSTYMAVSQIPDEYDGGYFDVTQPSPGGPGRYDLLQQPETRGPEG